MRSLGWRAVTAILIALGVSACAASGPASSVGTPGTARFADYPAPDIPESLVVPEAVRSRHINAWHRLQAGDIRTASREFNAVLTQAPNLYPAEVGLGFVYLANEQYRDAHARFAAAVAADDSYLPAWIGQADALLGLGRDADAVAAMERILVLDPQRELVRTRLELVRFRLSQLSIDAGRQARKTGRYDEAVRQFEQALALSPQSTMILQELTHVEVAAGRFDEAQQYAQQVIQIEPGEGEWQALLGEVLEARGQYADAADAYARADSLESNPGWRTRSREMRDRAVIAALPAEFGRVVSASSITRADVAAFVGIHLRALVERAPASAAAVATDVRDHWAAPWILSVTRAGIMTIYANHTFQPATAVRRGDLATIVASLVELIGNVRRTEVSAWQAARPTFADLPASNVFYTPAAVAVASRAMTTDPGGRFDPTRLATGAELDAAVRRISELAGD